MKQQGSTALLDFYTEQIQALVHRHAWNTLDDYSKIKEIYNFVRDEIAFGYNLDDAVPASAVLADGYGQCNTKATLFMALLRATNIDCRLHGFTIDKRMQKGAMRGITYLFAPREIVHTWVEVQYRGNWYAMEGLILDRPYLSALQSQFPACTGSFCGYGVGTENFQNPPIDWNENDTFIQKDAIVRDLGLFDDPDRFYEQYRQNLSPLKQYIFQHYARHWMNHNIQNVRFKK